MPILGIILPSLGIVGLSRAEARAAVRTPGMTYGLLLGEAVAISVMQDMKGCFTEPFAGFTFTDFDGTTVTV